MYRLFRVIDTVATYGLVVAGVAHAGLTPLFNPGFGIDQLWFIGAGLALLFLGGLNLARRMVADAGVKRLCLSGNVVGSVYLAVVASMIPAPHVYLVLACAGVATLTTALRPAWRTQSHTAA